MAYFAPAWNFVRRTTMSTVADIAAPTALMMRDRCMRDRSLALRSRRRWRVQCRTMPICEVVKETNTPTM